MLISRVVTLTAGSSYDRVDHSAHSTDCLKRAPSPGLFKLNGIDLSAYPKIVQWTLGSSWIHETVAKKVWQFRVSASFSHYSEMNKMTFPFGLWVEDGLGWIKHDPFGVAWVWWNDTSILKNWDQKFARNKEGVWGYQQKALFLLEKWIIDSPARTFMVRKCFFKPVGEKFGMLGLLPETIYML